VGNTDVDNDTTFNITIGAPGSYSLALTPASTETKHLIPTTQTPGDTETTSFIFTVTVLWDDGTPGNAISGTLTAEVDSLIITDTQLGTTNVTAWQGNLGGEGNPTGPLFTVTATAASGADNVLTTGTTITKNTSLVVTVTVSMIEPLNSTALETIQNGLLAVNMTFYVEV